MKKITVLACFILSLLGGTVSAQELASTGNAYRLKDVIEVAGRQGIAADKDYYYVSSSTGLYKYKNIGHQNPRST